MVKSALASRKPGSPGAPSPWNAKPVRGLLSGLHPWKVSSAVAKPSESPAEVNCAAIPISCVIEAVSPGGRPPTVSTTWVPLIPDDGLRETLRAVESLGSAGTVVVAGPSPVIGTGVTVLAGVAVASLPQAIPMKAPTTKSNVSGPIRRNDMDRYYYTALSRQIG